MESLIASFLVAAAGFGWIAFERWKRRQAPSRARWREPAPDSWQAGVDELARAAFPLSVTVEAFRDEDGHLGMVAMVRGLDPSIMLRSTGRTEGDVQTGHLGFDRQVYVQGNTDHVRALLDGPTRDAVLGLLRGPLRGGQFVVEGGELRAVLPAVGYGSLGDPLAEAAAVLGRVAHRLADPIHVASELAKSARTDRVSAVRLLCLRTLLREHSRRPSIVNPVFRHAAGDEDAEVRLEAATALGAEGVPVLQALVADASVEDGLGARAAEALGTELPADLARTTLRQELAASSDRHRMATACACASTLGLRGEPQDEDLLLSALPDGRDEALRLAAARALGAVGSARAVPPLAELSSSDSAALRRAGREAIAAIQSRLQGATPGQLSLGTADSGQVSLAEDVAGRLSDPGPADR
jgi:hypothetical protein